MDSLKKKLTSIDAQIKEGTPKSYAIVAAAIILLSLILEIFVFNFKWLNSAFDKPLDITPVKSGSAVAFNNINSKVKYLYFNVGEGNQAAITVSAEDAANANGISAPQRTVLGDVKRSQYIRLHFSGEVKNLRISVSGAGADEVILNAKVPLMFSWLRFLTLSLIIMTLYVLRPSSKLYQYKTNLKSVNQLVIAGLLIVAQAAVMWNMIHWNSTAIIWHKNYEHHRQYYNLIENIKQGRLNIKDNNTDGLSSLENPYDMGERYSKDVSAKWDYAFYNGKYYVYFGAAPAILFYLPYNLITGQDLPNYVMVYILSVLTMIGIMLLLWEIIKKWFPDTPFLAFLIISVVYGAVSLFGYAVYKPDFYLVPSASALMFGIWGLALWIGAEKTKTNKKGIAKTTLIPWRLCAGSVCIALIAGCRPQMILAAFLGVMLFWNAAFKERTLFSKSSVKATAAVCVPFVIVAAALMWYNFARFSSPFDFGANYNLTTNDMTHRGWVWGRTGLGIFSYLFQPISFDAVFPFLNDFGVQTTYQGLTLTEMMVGGVFRLFPILIFGIYGVFKKRIFPDKRAYRMVYMSLIAVIILAVLDAQMAGLLTRYFVDFVWFIMLAVSVTVFAMYNSDKYNKKTLTKIVLTLSCISLIMVFLRIFAHSEDAIIKANPVTYYQIQHLIAFWM